MNFDKPEDIRNSMINDNKEHLSNAGRKGAEVTNQNKEIDRARREITEEEIQQQNRQDKINHIYSEILHREGEEAADKWLYEIRSE